ncbi:beta strand repeat-containing protein [Ekhidna sp.]|uniref:beta strand repeat-containing protein n=1 Tax=Ekhidna sp. TaxID=2608089 RepID=UPI003B590E74
MKHLIISIFTVILITLTHTSIAQSVGIGTENPNSNAILELVAPTNEQGLLVPRMTTAQRTSSTFTSNLSSTENGLLVYDSNENKFFFWINNQWVELATGNLNGLPDQVGQNGKYLTTDGSTALWGDMDFSTLTNVPTGLSDGDDVNDADADATNEFQDLSLTTNTLELSNSTATVDLSGYLDNTDAQNLDFTSGIISLSGDPDATLIDLSSYDTDFSDDFDGIFSSLSGIPTGLSDGDDVDDADADATNELQDISTTGAAGNISLSSGSTLNLNVDDADADPNNEDQTVSAGTGISVNQVGDDFEVTNTAPDQTVSITDGGSGNITVGGTYPNLTIDVPSLDDADADATNELQDISTTGAAGNISLSSGSTLNLNVDDADADPNNEDQTVSAGTGISVNQVGDDFEVTNTAPDQTVSITDGGSGNITVGGTYPSLTIDVPSLDDADADATNELQDISTTGAAGNISLSSGSTLNLNVDDADADATNEIELPAQTGQSGNYLTTDGSSPSWSSIAESQWTTNGTSINYTTGNVNIGAGTIPSSRLQLSTNNASSTTPQLTIQESDASSDASLYFNRSGTNLTMGIDATDGSFKMSGANALGSNDRFIMDSQGTLGIGVTPNAQFHVQTNTVEGTTARLTNTASSATSKIGILNELDNQGTATKTGIWNDIDGTTGETGNVKGIYNIISPTDGTTYGSHTQINALGTGIRYGSFSDVRGASGNSSRIYGFRANMDHDGTGDSYAFYGQSAGTTSGNRYGVFIDSEDFNYFTGHIGIGDQNPDVELTIKSFDINSTNPLIRMTSGAASSDAAISFETGGLGQDFFVGVDATDNAFKISDAGGFGANDRLTISSSGDIGIGQPSPSARLDVVGTTELNGALTVSTGGANITGNTLVTGTTTLNGFLNVTDGVQITNEYSYFSAKIRFESYHPSEFKQIRFSTTTSQLVANNFTNQEVYFAGGSSALGYASTPVKLPDGAIVTDLEAYVLDNDATAGNFVRVNLYRSQIGVANSNQNMAQIETTTESASVQTLTDSTIFNGTIDNSTYSYRLLFSGREGSQEIQLHGVRITYTVNRVD